MHDTTVPQYAGSSPSPGYWSPRVDTLRVTLAIASMEEIADALEAQNPTKLEIVWSVAGSIIEERGRIAEPLFVDPNQLPLLREVA